MNTTPNLKALLEAVLSGERHRAEISALVHVAHKMAVAYLGVKRRQGTLDPGAFGLTLEDLAFDCVGELFGRNERGEFFKLEQFFQDPGWEETDETELTIRLRRLVFSKVNESLSRRYRENDPNLARTIRTLKDAVRGFDGAAVVLYGSRRWIVITTLDRGRDALPLVPSELLESHFAHKLGKGVGMPDVMQLLASYLADNPRYRRGYPITGLAQVVQAAMVRLGVLNLVAQTEAQEPFLVSERDVERVVSAAVVEVQGRMQRVYVGKGKVDAESFTAYMLSTREILRAEFGGQEGDPMTYFEFLRFFIRSLSEDAYYSVHRNRLEYLVKLGRSAVVERLRLVV